MTFLHPLALAGLAAAAVPALLHLYRRRIPPELDFPAVRYLREAAERSARRLRFRHLLLLLLRTALIVALVLAAAHPLLPGAGAAHAPTALVVVLDNSASSGAVRDGQPVLDRLRAVADRILQRARAGDRLTLLTADGVARTGTAAELRAAVASLAPSPARLDLVAATTSAARLADAAPAGEREVDVVSDGQRSALGDGRAEIPPGVRVRALAAPPRAPAANRGVTRARAVGGTLLVTVGGTPGAGEGPLTVTEDGRVVGRALAAPGETVSVPLPPARPGWSTGEVALEPDELALDDARAFARYEAPAPAVVVAPDAGPFVRTAVDVLRDAGRVGAGRVVRIGAEAAAGPGIVLPPADPALVGALDRDLAGRGVSWRFAGPGTPGPIVAADPAAAVAAGAMVRRRFRLAGGDRGDVLATVNGEPWLVRAGPLLIVGSALDTGWTDLPARAGFVPFVEALARAAAREAPAVRDTVGAVGVTFTVRGADTVGAVVAGTDPGESDLTPAGAAELAEALGARVLAPDALAAGAFAGGRRADASGLLLVLALILTTAELGVAAATR